MARWSRVGLEWVIATSRRTLDYPRRRSRTPPVSARDTSPTSSAGSEVYRSLLATASRRRSRLGSKTCWTKGTPCGAAATKRPYQNRRDPRKLSSGERCRGVVSTAKYRCCFLNFRWRYASVSRILSEPAPLRTRRGLPGRATVGLLRCPFALLPIGFTLKMRWRAVDAIAGSVVVAKAESRTRRASLGRSLSAPTRR